jgi:hypothetical protein
MMQDTASKFFRPLLTEGDVQQALAVSPYFLAYLQAKIEAYATALLETELPYDPDPTKQVAAIVAFERARTFVQAYEELLAELMDARPQDMDSPQDSR